MDWYDLQRVIVGLCGILLLVSGTRLYRMSILAPGAMIGAYLGVLLTMGLADPLRLLGIAVFGVLGGVLMLLIEKLAIAIVCAMVGGALTHYLLPLYLGYSVEWYWLIVGSVVGGIGFAPILPKTIPIWMSMVGANAVIWSMRQPWDSTWFLGLTMVGTLIQIAFGASIRDMDDP